MLNAIFDIGQKKNFRWYLKYATVCDKKPYNRKLFV